MKFYLSKCVKTWYIFHQIQQKVQVIQYKHNNEYKTYYLFYWYKRYQKVQYLHTLQDDIQLVINQNLKKKYFYQLHKHYQIYYVMKLFYQMIYFKQFKQILKNFKILKIFKKKFFF